MATARDVAKRAGTSTAVVSYVFNNGPRNVSAPLRQKVLDAATELNYKPNALARALSFGRTASIGLIVPDISNPFFGELARTLESAALERGNLLLIGDAGLDEATEARIISAFLERRVDSVVMISLVNEPDFESFRRSNIPVVALHPVRSDTSVSSLTIDYESAAADATSHLIEHGYESVGLLNAPEGCVGSCAHEEGYLRAVARASHSLHTEIKHSPISRSAAAALTMEWLASPNRPRAITCATDEQAFGVLYAASQLNLKVPEDLAVIGFDATDHAHFTVPPLASVRQPIAQMAHRAIHILTSDVDLPIHERLDYELVPNVSCGCQPRGFLP